VRGEFALIYTVYNFKRCINILGAKTMLAMLNNWQPDYTGIPTPGHGWLKTAFHHLILRSFAGPIKLAA
jgi:hypothetical protein